MKKLTTLLLILAMAITLTACGGNEEIVSGETPDNSSISTPPVSSSPDDTTSGASDEPPGTAPDDSSVPDSANETPAVAPQQDIGIEDVIKFGGYDWLVLDEIDGRKLIISQNVVEYREYHSVYRHITWAESDIRHYLNGEFFDNNFTDDEKNRIAETEVINNDNPWCGTYGGADTTDKVFLLSLDEVVRYFGDSGQLYNRPSDNTGWITDEYNADRIAYDADGKASTWWLRSPGSDYGREAAVVYSNGDLLVYGKSVYHITTYGVRPALWLNP